MMFPMERSRIYKILSEIFTHPNIKPTTNLCGITLKESSSHTSDIDFWCDENATLIGYLRIVNPPENCVDGEYCLIYHFSLSDEDANIGIGPTGATRVYGDEIQKSFIYRTLCANKNKFGEYVKELICAEQKLVVDKVVCAVKTFCEKLMNENASTFDQLDMTVDRDDCKFFYVRSLNSPHMNFQFDVVSHIDTISIPHNEVWVRFSVASGSLWTPITINPYIRQVVIHAETEQPVFTDSFNVKQLVELATKIRDATGFVVCCNEGASDKSQARSIYIRRMLEKSDELSMLKKSIVDINKDGKTAYVIDPNYVISNENINKNNKLNTILDIKAHIDSLVDKKLKKFVESGSIVYMTKDYLTDQILGQLKNDWHKDVYRSVYSSVWCTLAESRFKNAAYEFEKHFIEYATLDYDDCFTVIFGLQKIDDNLPGIEIKFYNATQNVCVRMLDHKSSGSGTFSRPLIELKTGYESKVYFDTFKNTNCTYKSFLANVVSKIVLLEGLS